MGKGKSGHKPNNAAKRSRAKYKASSRYEMNKKRKARKQQKIYERLMAKGKGPLVEEKV